jgi:hypothetical protein
MAGAVGAAVVDSIGLNSMADDPASAVVTGRGEFEDRAFKAIKGVTDAAFDNFERFVVVVSADFTLCHEFSPPRNVGQHPAEI